MVRSMKLAFLLFLSVAFPLAYGSEDYGRMNLDHENILKMLNDTKRIFMQHSQVSAEQGDEMKEMLHQLWQERQEEMHRTREEEDVKDIQLLQLREELRQLKEDGRENQVHSAIDNTLSLQGLVIEIQRDMREMRQHQQPAALNISLQRFIQQYQIDFHALKAIVTEQGREMKMDINLLQDSLATMNDSFSSHSVVEASEELLQQCRNESQAASDALTTQLDTILGNLGVVEPSEELLQQCRNESQAASDVLTTQLDTCLGTLGVIEASEELLQQCRNESQAASDALTTQLDTFLGTLENNELIFSHQERRFYVNNYLILTWDKARTWCQALGGDLAQPSGSVMPFLQEVARRYPDKLLIWLGASDQQQEGQWKWLSGTDLPAGFPWGEDEPNNVNDNEHCLEANLLETKPYCNDASCSEKFYFVCDLGPDL